jgi:transcriptional regulator with XRE-family HTH domain
LQSTEQKAFYQKVGQSIRSIRQRKQIKQEILATHLGLNRVSISNIETGKQRIQLHTLVEIASFFKTPLDELVPMSDLIRSELDSRLEKKISSAEISNNSEAVEKVRSFIQFSTANTADHALRLSTTTKNRAKSK